MPRTPMPIASARLFSSFPDTITSCYELIHFHWLIDQPSVQLPSSATPNYGFTDQSAIPRNCGVKGSDGHFAY